MIGAEPDGLNINDGYGSTHLEHLRDAVVSHDADAGIAHDGDADRCLAIDHLGREVDGDQIMAMLALAFRDRGELAHNTLVATVMSNLGPAAGDAARRASPSPRPASATATCSRRCVAAGSAWAASSPGTS